MHFNYYIQQPLLYINVLHRWLIASLQIIKIPETDIFVMVDIQYVHHSFQASFYYINL